MTRKLQARLNLIAERIVAGSKLSVFDFDDTLVSSSGSISVQHKSGEKDVLDSATFAYYKSEDGDKLDFTNFNAVTRPRVIKAGMDKLRAAVKAGDKVAILTARPRGAASAVSKYLGSLGIKGLEVVALQSSDPADKAAWIEKASAGVDEVSFTDDSSRNVEAVKARAGNIKGKLICDNPAKPSQDSDYEGPESKEVFESDKPSTAIDDIKKPDKKLDKDWWEDQTDDFRREYCRSHPGSKYC